MSEFIDHPKEKIQEQLERVLEFKREHPELSDLTRIRSWERWCTSYEYRKREWEWRQKYFANSE